MKLARCGDGEAFAILVNNPGVQSPVQLDLMLVEADQVTTPLGFQSGRNYVDGIQFDRYGNPLFYHVLAEHPGDMGIGYATFDTIPAAAMLHYFRVDRPGQVRGIPEITPALMLYLLVSFVLADGPVTHRWLISMLVAMTIEVSQLFHAPWIDSIRQTTLGGLVLGFGFLWTDLVCYSVGITVGALSEHGFLPMRAAIHNRSDS